MTTWAFLSWFLDNWFFVLWGASIVVAYVYGGKTLAFVIFTFGATTIAYNRGKSSVNEHAQKVDRERENAYKDIDNRATNRSDVIERLRKRSY